MEFGKSSGKKLLVKKKLEDSYPDFKTYYEVIVIRHCGTRKRTDIKMNGID